LHFSSSMATTSTHGDAGVDWCNPKLHLCNHGVPTLELKLELQCRGIEVWCYKIEIQRNKSRYDEVKSRSDVTKSTSSRLNWTPPAIAGEVCHAGPLPTVRARVVAWGRAGEVHRAGLRPS
jgi:hypothetical protein